MSIIQTQTILFFSLFLQTVESMTAVVLGLNSAFQRCVQCNDLVLGSVNRAKSSSTGVGGKGQGAYLAAVAVANSENEIALAQFVGGLIGESLCCAIRKRKTENIEDLWIQCKSETRVCTTIMHGEDATEFVEPSGIITQEELSLLEKKLKMRSHSMHGLLCSGSLPPGIFSYENVIRAACPKMLFLDTVVLNGIENIDKTDMKVILKLNAREILSVAGFADPNAHLSDAAVPRPADLISQAASSLCKKYGIHIVFYTDGPFDAGCYFAQSDRLIPIMKCFAQLPGPLRSPIGAGDTVAGTTFARLLAGYDDLDAFAFGLSCGAASCLTSENAVFDLDIIPKLPYKPILSSEK
uniref:Carbohydrate kinase PfkB domain-containing protein n=1 Tax=Aureoumbra lagunensis TaxID=44058 RepID=A0A7S3NNK6_9STRA